MVWLPYAWLSDSISMVIAGKVRDDCLCEYSEFVDQVLVLIESIRLGVVIRSVPA